MAPPEMLDEPAASVAPAPMWSDRGAADANLRTELVHRHLLARMEVAREQLEVLEDHSPAPEVLVARFGSTIAEAQRVLDAERAEAAERVEARRRAVEARVAEITHRAEIEAAALREVATRLRATAGTVVRADATMPVGPSAPPPAAPPTVVDHDRSTAAPTAS